MVCPVADGVAIAWAVSEHLINLGAATLFATHFAQLSELAALYPTARLWHFEAAVRGGARQRLEFTYRLLPGAQTGSHYGLTLASAVCMPPHVIAEARRIVAAVDADARQPAGPITPEPQSSGLRTGAGPSTGAATGSEQRKEGDGGGSCEARRALRSLAHRVQCVARAWAGDPGGVDLAAQLAPLQREARQLLAPAGGLGDSGAGASGASG